MITTTEIINDKRTKLILDFSDENVVLVGETEVAGDESATYSIKRLRNGDIIRSIALSCRAVAVSVGSCGTSDGLSVLCGGLQ